MLVTAKDIEKLIEEAKASGAAPAEIEELQDHLSEIKSGALYSKTEATFMFEETKSDGSRVIRLSTSPMSVEEDDDDFEGVTLKPIKRRTSTK
ncbi:MAG: hypothetical protein SAL07_20735 [Oscillatoria sp. PMC 1051.18]|uniref:hypothetical protein n=1 Tax=Oscillatoria salina TaxID=331517 RepID=UPI0013BD4831|nr:hypothetical protein [Oscillatoria salina]MBZ8182666.1 hypothetical protein [Oscillatoria salina IIICB1]MEC4892579.1 hypothetical protein [Oscillatoria sp. PMC 1050.18]MEC5032334.1 hypothetical protein [Oscillatoria sp. PMC 1051.18]NET89870.1 hypothetical protein [Kamptonema sp. SIO1D9]